MDRQGSEEENNRAEEHDKDFDEGVNTLDLGGELVWTSKKG